MTILRNCVDIQYIHDPPTDGWSLFVLFNGHLNMGHHTQSRYTRTRTCLLYKKTVGFAISKIPTTELWGFFIICRGRVPDISFQPPRLYRRAVLLNQILTFFRAAYM